MARIKSIEKGWGESSAYFTTEEKSKQFPNYVDEIREEETFIGKGQYNNLTIIKYTGVLNHQKVFCIEANSSLTITYYPE